MVDLYDNGLIGHNSRNSFCQCQVTSPDEKMSSLNAHLPHKSTYCALNDEICIHVSILPAIPEVLITSSRPLSSWMSSLYNELSKIFITNDPFRVEEETDSDFQSLKFETFPALPMEFFEIN